MSRFGVWPIITNFIQAWMVVPFGVVTILPAKLNIVYWEKTNGLRFHISNPFKTLLILIRRPINEIGADKFEQAGIQRRRRARQ